MRHVPKVDGLPNIVRLQQVLALLLLLNPVVSNCYVLLAGKGCLFVLSGWNEKKNPDHRISKVRLAPRLIEATCATVPSMRRTHPYSHGPGPGLPLAPSRQRFRPRLRR